MRHNWIDITCITDYYMTYYCTITGEYKYVDFYVDVDCQRAAPDEEILRQLGHKLRENI